MDAPPSRVEGWESRSSGRELDMRGNRSLRSVVAALVLLPMMLVFGPATPASATGCWVKNVRTQVVGTNVQAALNASEQGDVIKVRGTCRGGFAARDITLVGPATIGWPEGAPGHPTELVSTSGRVTLKNLVITGGSDSAQWGGGIHNVGILILKGYTNVTGNFGEDGAGGINNQGLLVMKDYAEVTGNEVLWGPGGGIWNEGTLLMKDHAKVAGNDGTFGGGVYNGGTLVLRDSAAIVRNRAQSGGGVYTTGLLKMKGASRITRNAAGTGGGIHSEGSVRFSRWWHGTVCGNSPDDWAWCSR